MSYSHTPFGNMSTPWSWSRTLRRPTGPIAARKANTRVTPPNCAKTPEAEVTMRRSVPRGFPVATAYANSAPASAPTRALAIEMTALLRNDLMMYACWSSVKFESVRWPSLSPSEPAAMMPVGRRRNSPTKTKKGATPSSSASRWTYFRSVPLAR